jgi:hypothetical protein
MLANATRQSVASSHEALMPALVARECRPRPKLRTVNSANPVQH